jgi:hypothetical protein
MSVTEPAKISANRFAGMPILRVENLAASLDYDVRVLGFRVDGEI